MSIVCEKNTAMLQEVLKFPDLLSKGLEAAQEFDLPKDFETDKIIHIGMGASGLVGSYLRTYLTRKVPEIAFDVIKAPTFPFDPNALFILYSYSGTTLETRTALSKVLERREDGKIIVASSGGKLWELAKEHALPYIKLPKGFESRSHLPYGVSFLAYLLGKMFNIKAEVTNELEGAIEKIESKKKDILSSHTEDLKNMAQELEATFPLVVGDTALSPVLLRFVNQLAENSKHLSSSVVLPEGAHNLICPLNRTKMPVSLLFLERASLDELTTTVTKNFREILAKRKSFRINIEDTRFSWETLLYPTFLVDMLSVLMADEKHVSSHDIEEIHQVKNER